jgi:hypothetical protein
MTIYLRTKSAQSLVLLSSGGLAEILLAFYLCQWCSVALLASRSLLQFFNILPQYLGTEVVVAVLTFPTYRNQFGISQFLEMMGDSGLGDRECLY